MNKELFVMVRRYLGQTQTEFAETLEIGVSTVRDIERGARPISSNVEARIHKAFRIDREFIDYVEQFHKLKELG